MPTFASSQRSYIVGLSARLSSCVATAIFVIALTQSGSYAQPLRLKQPNAQSPVARLLLASNAKPIQMSPKSCWIEYEGGWAEICWEESYPGYTDRDWDTYTVCEWEWIEIPYEVCEPDCEWGLAGAAPLPGKGKAASRSVNDKYAHRPGDKLELAPIRTYRANAANRSSRARQQFGDGWYSTWDRRIVITSGGNRAEITRGDGSELSFMKRSDGKWESKVDAVILFETAQNGQADAHWLLVGPLSVEAYDASGRLRRLTSRLPGGGSFQLNYTSDGDAGLVESVTDSRGQTLRFAYENGYVSTVTDIDGGVTRFAQQSGRLVAVYYPSGAWREFQYDPSGRARYIDHGKPTKSIGAGARSSSSAVRAGVLADIAQDIGNAPGSTGFQETSQSCPVPPPDPPRCEDWMRQEIAQCTYEALQRKINNDFQYCDPILNQLYYTNDVNEMTRITDNYYACKANNEARYWSDHASCTSRYPQCY